MTGVPMFPPSPTLRPLASRAWAVKDAVMVFPLEPVIPTTARPQKSSSHMAVAVVTWTPERSDVARSRA